MKKRLQIALSVLVIAVIALATKNLLIEKEINSVEELQKTHAEFLANSPFKETKMLPRADRKKLGLPPNAYNEQMWELSMDPNTGRPMPERVLETQEQLRQNRLASRGVSGESATPWIDRGPNNQGGRTRGIMFDPNDVGNANPADDYTRVFAGGVSGGLWVNEDITDANQSWTQLNIQANISVTAIIADPNNSNTFFIASGESFTSGQAVGRGIWRSSDAGITWDNIFGGLTSTVGTNVNGIFYVNDIIARNVGGSTELYAAIVSASYSDANSPNNTNGADTIGLYKSTDNGDTWARFNIQHTNGNYKSPCDIELDINNNIWFTTTGSPTGDPGGDIYQSTDGNTFTLINTISNARRTEFEPSQNNANLFWVAAQVGNGANLFFTNNAFSTISALPGEPADVDDGIPDTDYTRNQAFYDLPIEADANDVLYVGGIDLFRTVDFGINWTQISKWSNNNNLAALQVPLVHADQHAIVFRPGNDNEIVFGNDGGVAYGSDILSIVNSNNTNAIQDRNKDYNTTHFYYGDINQVDIADGDDLVGGLQDNGTQISIDAGPGANGYVDPRTGDGAYTEISKNGDYLITSYPGRTHIYSSFPNYNSNQYTIVNAGGGDFINQAELDDNRNVLYVNSSVGSGRITRYINVNFESVVSSSDLTNALLNSPPSAFKLNPHSTGGIPPTSTATLLVGLKNGRLLKLTNADNVPTWSNIGDGSFVGSVSDIEFGQNENEIFVTMHNYGVNSVWYTTDGGTTWANKEGNLPDLPVKAILQNPLLPTEVIIGTELGMWGTADITATSPVWTQIYNGMSDVTVVDLDLRASDNIILATTHGRGLFTGQFTSTPLSVTDNVFVDSQIKVFPTISNGEVFVKASKNIGEVDFNIFNISGQKVYNTNLDLNTTGKQLSLNLASGMYLVKLSKGTFTETKRIIIR